MFAALELLAKIHESELVKIHLEKLSAGGLQPRVPRAERTSPARADSALEEIQATQTKDCSNRPRRVRAKSRDDLTRKSQAQGRILSRLPCEAICKTAKVKYAAADHPSRLDDRQATACGC